MMLAFSCVAMANEKIERLEMPDGKVYEGVTITKKTPAWIKIMHTRGITKLMLSECDEKMQILYDYDAEKAAEYLKMEAVKDKEYEKKAAARRAANAKKMRAKALKDEQFEARNKIIKLQKSLVKPMKFHVIQAQKNGASLCKVQVEVKNSRIKRVKKALGYVNKRVHYTSWSWLGGEDKWYYVKDIGAVVDKDVVLSYGILTGETYSYTSVGGGGKTVSVIEVRDENGAPLNAADPFE